MNTHISVIGNYLKIEYPDGKIEFTPREGSWWEYRDNLGTPRLLIHDRFGTVLLDVTIPEVTNLTRDGIQVVDFEDISTYLSKAITTITNENLNLPIMTSDAANWTGWAQYVDTQYTEANKFTLTTGSRILLPNNGVSKIESQLPEGVSSFYDPLNSKILGAESGDAYVARIDVCASTNNNNGVFLLSLDIGGTQGEIFERMIDFPRGTGITRQLSIPIFYYSFDTFLQNGAEVYVEGINGTTSIWDIRYVISRIHKSRA